MVTPATVLPALRPYQREIAAAVLDSVFHCRGETFSVEIARQGGKNELSAWMEVTLLVLAMAAPHDLVKCAPTFNPQCLISMHRLVDRLDGAGFAGTWYTEAGRIVRLGQARAVFLSAEPGARVLGSTAHLLLEIDESQDVSKEKYTKEFRPMAAAENATVVLYGTTWDESTLLEEVKQANLEREKADGVKRHFRFDWEAVAACNPPYRSFVEAERERLGEDHPLFRTQYRLLTVREGGGLFTPEQLALLRGTHHRERYPALNTTYVAGLDLAGEAMDGVTGTNRRDSTVLTIAAVDHPAPGDYLGEPVVRVVEHYAWTGQPHDELHRVFVQYLRDVWNVRRVCVDATGLGEPVASYLKKALGSRVAPVKFTPQTKSDLGYRLLAAVNGGRLKLYRGDGSVAWMLCLDQLEKARATYRPNRTMNFDVDPARGHDDYLMSLALCLEAAARCEVRKATGGQRGQ